MAGLVFTDAFIFQRGDGFVKGSFSISGNRIRDVVPALRAESGDNPDLKKISLRGRRVLPGLVDIHTHGNSGYDFSDGSPEGLYVMGKYLAAHGITSFAPTSVTLPYEKLASAFRTAADYKKNRPAEGARISGIRMEGPFLSEKRKGAQNAAFLKLPDAEVFSGFQEECGHIIRIVDVAPELEGAETFIRRVSADCRVSVAHTDASYGEALSAFEAGASHLTHLFNAMPPVHHRYPGVIGAASEKENVTAELICDGIHVHPSIIRMAFRLFPGRICLVSDALRCCGMPEGGYELGGQQVLLKNGEARLPDGTLAGAASNLFEDMVNAVRFGVREEDAVLAATLNPAKVLGTDAETGSIEAGKKADFIICDEKWNPEQVWLDGARIR